MKQRITWLVLGGMLTLGAAGCAEKKTTEKGLAVQLDATAPVGEVISTAQAVEWTHRFQEINPTRTWGCLFESTIFKKLLSQDGCEGLRIYNAINAEDKNTFVLTGVSAAGDLANGLLADMANPCPPGTYTSPLLSVTPELLAPPVLPAGGFIPLEQAVSMTHRYQEAYLHGLWGGYYSAYVYSNLIEQPGCIGIRIYNGVKEDQSECYVLVGVNAEGADMTSGLLYDISMPCPSTCRSESPLML